MNDAVDNVSTMLGASRSFGCEVLSVTATTKGVGDAGGIGLETTRDGMLKHLEDQPLLRRKDFEASTHPLDI